MGNGGSSTRKRRHGRSVVYFIVCCAAAGIYLWHTMTRSSEFLESARAACTQKCSPSRAKLETTRQELVYQQAPWRSPSYQSPECKCIH